MGRKQTQDEIIKRFKEAHPDGTYDYSKVVYIDCKHKVIIGCPIHGYFEQEANSHYRGIGCMKCAKDKLVRDRKDKYKKEFEKKAREVHPNKYFDYSKVVYVSARKKVIIGCPNCKIDFLQRPHDHLQGKGCGKCGRAEASKKTKLSVEILKEKSKEIHPTENYDYSEFVYINKDYPSIIICPLHGKFLQSYGNHINRRQGCPLCKNKSEGILKDILKENLNYGVIHNRGFEWCKKKRKLRYDFIIEELKCIVELDGNQHFVRVGDVWNNDPEQQLENDIFKNQKAMENGYTMIRVYQPDIFERDPETILKLILSIHRYREPQLICIGDIYNDRF